MKKTVSTLLVCVLLVGAIFTLSSCSLIFGKYECKTGLTTTSTLEFSVGMLTITDRSEFLGNVDIETYECFYKIEDTSDGRQITFIYESDEDEDDIHPVFNGTMTFSEIEKDGVKQLKIGIFTLDSVK